MILFLVYKKQKKKDKKKLKGNQSSAFTWNISTHKPIQYDLPFGLCTGRTWGLVTLHSYQTFLVVTFLQNVTWTLDPAETYTGDYQPIESAHIHQSKEREIDERRERREGVP